MGNRQKLQISLTGIPEKEIRTNRKKKNIERHNRKERSQKKEKLESADIKL